jgi:hypothetical protein
METLSLKHGKPNFEIYDPCDNYPPAKDNSIIQQWEVPMNASRWQISNVTIIIDDSSSLNKSHDESNQFYFILKNEAGCIIGQYDQPEGVSIVPVDTLSPTVIPKAIIQTQIDYSDKLWVIITISFISLLCVFIVIILLLCYRKRLIQSFNSNPRILKVSSNVPQNPRILKVCSNVPQNTFKDILKKINGRDYDVKTNLNLEL